jgi:hypothetical protein
LKDRAVPIHPVPGVGRSGEAQVRAFVRPEGCPDDLRAVYPICYCAADGSATLRDLYVRRNMRFLRDSYKRVLSFISSPDRRNHHIARLPLSDLPDLGPGHSRSATARAASKVWRPNPARTAANPAPSPHNWPT